MSGKGPDDGGGDGGSNDTDPVDRLAELVRGLTGCSMVVAIDAVRAASATPRRRDAEEAMAVVARAVVAVRRDENRRG